MTPEQRTLFAKLTPLEQRFAVNMLAGMQQVEAYIQASGRTSYDAARANAARAAADPDFKAYMMAMKEDMVSEAIMTRQEALERLTNFARTDLKDLVEFGEYEIGQDEFGNPVVQAAWKIKDSVLQDPAKMAVISELTAGKEGIKVKTHSPLVAIQQLSKMQGWDSAQKVDLSNSDGTLAPKVIDASKLSTETLEELLAAKSEEQ